MRLFGSTPDPDCPACGGSHDNWTACDALVELAGNHTRETAPDATTPFATEDGGWSTHNLDAYLEGRFDDLK
jgi:hypothetical protein